MWFSACNELLQFLFGVGAVVCWLHFQQGGKRRWCWYAGTLAGLALALLSKESAVAIAALLVATSVGNAGEAAGATVVGQAVSPAIFASLLPPVILAAACALSVYLTRDNSFRFQDGSFSLHAPLWRIWPANFARLLWVWGLLGLAAAWTRRRAVIWRALLWAGISLLPYSFLTYSARIPSRQIYLASAGLALIVGAGMAVLEERRRSLAAVVCAVLLVHNVGYLWVKKRAQFLERAEPTEQLIALAKRTPGPIYMQCFPRAGLIAQEAVRLGAGKPVSDVIWDAAEGRARGAVKFCYARAAN
jgi:hypothetical protein